MRRFRGITTQLEQQAKCSTEKQFKVINKRQNKSRSYDDPLRLRWKDVIVFSLLLVFTGGYHWQVEAYQQCQMQANYFNQSVCR